MLRFIKKYLDITGEKIIPRLHAHEPYREEQCEKYWSQITTIPLSQFRKTIYITTPHKTKRNPSYKGCFSLKVRNAVKPFVIMMLWQKLLIQDILAETALVAQRIEHQASNLGVGGSNPSERID